jgi:hypothetical protein
VPVALLSDCYICYHSVRSMNSATTDLVGVDPLEYLNPFLEVIKSPETSGPITGTALTAIYKFLTRDIIGELFNS